MSGVVLQSRSIKIYMDGADINDIRELLVNPSISGITTNPTLMHGSGVQNYREFGQQVAELAGETQFLLRFYLPNRLS